MASKAKESSHVQKARKKLQKQLIASEKKITPESLKNMRVIIARQIARQKGERINLKGRHITLFDENQHPAREENKFVRRLLKQLKHPSTDKGDHHQLEGRVKNIL